MIQKVNDINKKLNLLKHIPSYRLKNLAEEFGIPKSGHIEILRRKIAEEVKYMEIEEIYEEYEEAGNVSIYLFQFKRKNLLGLNQEENLRLILKKYDYDNIFESQVKIKVTSIPQLVIIGYANKNKTKIKVRLEFKGKEIIERNAETREVIRFPPLIHTTAIIHLDGLVEIRTRSRRFADQICKMISKYFNEGSYESIIFNEDEIEELINWVKTFRNATIKPLSGGISSLRMTASIDSDLRNEKLYKNREELIGASIRTGVYLKFDFIFNKEDRSIGFQINSGQGKIFFKTAVSEEEIDYVLSKVKEIKGF